jgi:hypothetical protein
MEATMQEKISTTTQAARVIVTAFLDAYPLDAQPVFPVVRRAAEPLQDESEDAEVSALRADNRRLSAEIAALIRSRSNRTSR